MGKQRVVERGEDIPHYNVTRRDYFGDPGKTVGANLTSEEADAYIASMQAAGEKADFEKHRTPASWNEEPA